MLIKDQLKTRMEQLKVSTSQLAKACEVSNQSVRHWLAGRSFPGKRHVPVIERTLSFRLDFSQGERQTLPTTEQVLDLDLFVKISKLSPDFKREISTLVDMILAAEARGSPMVMPIPVLAKPAPKHVARAGAVKHATGQRRAAA